MNFARINPQGRFVNFNNLRPGGKPTFHVAVSAKALFNINHGWDGKGGLSGWRKFQKAETLAGHKINHKGPAYPIINELVRLNAFSKDPVNEPLVKVSIVSQMKMADSGRFIEALKRDFGKTFDTSWGRESFIGGRSPIGTLQELGVDLFLTTNPYWALKGIEAGLSAVHVVRHKGAYTLKQDPLATPILWSFDGDNTIWDGTSEDFFQKIRKEACDEVAVREFRARESRLGLVPSLVGPLWGAFASACDLRSLFPEDEWPRSPFELAVMTARGTGADQRVNTTLTALDTADYCDIVECLDGKPKGPFLKRYKASIHYDDGPKHITSASDYRVIGGHIIDGIQNRELIAELKKNPW